LYRYTTPTITLTIDDIDFSTVSLWRVAISGKGKRIIKEYEAGDSAIGDDTLLVTLTQEETASMSAGDVEIQVRMKLSNGAVLATTSARVKLFDVLDKAVI